MPPVQNMTRTEMNLVTVLRVMKKHIPLYTQISMKLMLNQQLKITIIMEKRVTNPFIQTLIQKRYLGRTKFTSHNLIDSNVIDYMTVSESVYHNMLSVRVQDFIQSRSGNCQLSCLLSVYYKKKKKIEISQLDVLLNEICTWLSSRTTTDRITFQNSNCFSDISSWM